MKYRIVFRFEQARTDKGVPKAAENFGSIEEVEASSLDSLIFAACSTFDEHSANAHGTIVMPGGVQDYSLQHLDGGRIKEGDKFNFVAMPPPWDKDWMQADLVLSYLSPAGLLLDHMYASGQLEPDFKLEVL